MCTNLEVHGLGIEISHTQHHGNSRFVKLIADFKPEAARKALKCLVVPVKSEPRFIVGPSFHGCKLHVARKAMLSHGIFLAIHVEKRHSIPLQLSEKHR